MLTIMNCGRCAMLVLVAATLGDAEATPLRHTSKTTLVANNVIPANWRPSAGGNFNTHFTSTILDAPRPPSVSFSGKRDMGSQLH